MTMSTTAFPASRRQEAQNERHPGFVVREAGAGDAQLIADLTRACWANKVAPSSTGHRETAARVRQDLQQGGGFILISGERPVGSVRWIPLETQPDIWEIARMGVLPACRGARLSQHLLEAVIHRAQGSGAVELRLAVRADQPRLLDFYAAFGFELAPELEYRDHSHPGPAPTIMRRMLGY
jgi:ribosomal protein S18 acetylase RimI-like enzyme